MGKISALFRKIKQFIKYRLQGVKVHWEADVQNSKLGFNSIISHHSSLINSQIGDYSSIGRFSKINHVKIGAFCSISWDVTIGATNHPIDHITTHAFPYVTYAGNFVNKNNQQITKTFIGNDVWIGCNSVVLPGVKVGNGAIIGAGSIVTKDVPPYAVVAGNPAKIMKYRFSEESIKELEKIKWWNWDRKKIKENLELFQTQLDSSLIKELKKRDTSA
ncbi:CatB-related O-acetyltransferase [Fictibacillus halophilus]|uniref:CatB-related O-acetyltransferase n=1 Tax=Fictibacillus halophilus TaxID=1610490 RepID=UPI00299F43EE|nr:CatB-related O-acetyltransferase [Fictibacillus halophilus]